MTIKTLADIKDATSHELVAKYNTLTGKAIKKFSTRLKAEQQTWKAICEHAVVSSVAKKATLKKKSEGGKRDNYESREIKVLVDGNPKREGTRAHKKFAILLKMDGKTIRDLKAQEGKHPDLDKEAGWPATELRWAIKLDLVKIVNPHHASKAA